MKNKNLPLESGHHIANATLNDRTKRTGFKLLFLLVSRNNKTGPPNIPELAAPRIVCGSSRTSRKYICTSKLWDKFFRFLINVILVLEKLVGSPEIVFEEGFFWVFSVMETVVNSENLRGFFLVLFLRK